MFGMFIFSTSIGFWTLLAGIIGLPLLLCRKIPPKFAILWARGVLFCWKLAGRKYRYVGLENIPKGSAIIASQHQSALETIAYADLLQCPAYVLKKELYHIPIFGWYLAKAGMIAIDRSAKVQALNSVMKQAQTVLAEGRKIVIFPEGTRVPFGESKPYNKSVYKLYELGYPVIPVALNTGLLWRKKAWSLGQGEAVFSCLPAMPEGLSQADFMESLRAAIQSEAANL